MDKTIYMTLSQQKFYKKSTPEVDFLNVEQSEKFKEIDRSLHFQSTKFEVKKFNHISKGKNFVCEIGP